VGRTTYGGAWHDPQIVLTHRPPAESPRDVTFAGDLPTAVETARTAAGDQYVCVLGAGVAAQCLEAGVLDEVLMTVVPVLLGDGVRMPPGRHARAVGAGEHHAHRRGDKLLVRRYSPLNSGARLANIAVIPSVRSFDARNAEFHAAT
jgi:dihydrofolate reductase